MVHLTNKFEKFEIDLNIFVYIKINNDYGQSN